MGKNPHANITDLSLATTYDEKQQIDLQSTGEKWTLYLSKLSFHRVKNFQIF